MMISPLRVHHHFPGHAAASTGRTIGAADGQRIRIYYFCPDSNLASAGIRRLYRHVGLLSQAQFNAHILHLHTGFHRTDMPDVPIAYLDQMSSIEPDDIIVIPEGCPGIMKALKNHPGRKFAIALNWDYVFKDLPAGTNWRSLNIERVLAISPLIAEMISWSMGLPVHVLQSAVDRRLYYVQKSAKHPQITFITRKAAHVGILKRILAARNPDYATRIKWLPLDRLSEPDYAARIRESSIFMNLSEAEGYPTSCLEAMASGTLVAGYDSVGGRDLLHGQGLDQNCLLVPIGDYTALAYCLESVLKAILTGQWGQWQAVLSNALKTAEQVNPENERDSLIAFWEAIRSNSDATGNINGIQ